MTRTLTEANLLELHGHEMQAIGYVWGLQDAGADSGSTDTLRSMEFGAAYREHRRRFLTEEHWSATNIRDAYRQWAAGEDITA